MEANNRYIDEQSQILKNEIQCKFKIQIQYKMKISYI